MVQVRGLLDCGQPKEAASLLLRAPSRSPELQNALGVCWMRSGDVERALDLYRRTVLHNGVCFRSDATPKSLVNYATALLRAGNVAGCLAVLDETPRDAPGAARLREAIARWRRSLGLIRRISVALNGAHSGAHVPLGFPPGEL